MKNKHLSVLFTLFAGLLIIFILSSCSATNRITVEKGAIPPEFKKHKTTLVCVLKGRKSYDKYMKRNMKSNYRGKMVFLEKGQLRGNKYEDLDKYRYLLDCDEERNVDIMTHRTTSYTYRFYILDRKTDKSYYAPGRSSFFGKLITAYATNLEKERTKAPVYDK